MTATKKRSIISLVFSLIVAFCICFVALPSCATKDAFPAVNYEQAKVTRVVDGDTIVIDRGKGEEKVRLIGIDAPESVHPDDSRNSDAGKEASMYLQELLPPGTVVYLERDVSDTDRYDRLLRYVWLDVPVDVISDAPHLLVNALIVKTGHAVAKDYDPDTKYSTLLHNQY